VDENHFSVADLHNLVKNISIEDVGEEGIKGAVEHVWIDVACIDQENNALQMKETGRQAAIFEGAQSSYVWLNHLKTEHLRSLFGMLETIAFELDRDILDPSHNRSSAPVITRSRWLESATTTVQSLFQNDP